MDIPQGQRKLEIVAALAWRIVAKAGVDMKIYSSLERDRALKNADFVISQLVDDQARILDETIPEIRPPGAETNGAGTDERVAHHPPGVSAD